MSGQWKPYCQTVYNFTPPDRATKDIKKLSYDGQSEKSAHLLCSYTLARLTN